MFFKNRDYAAGWLAGIIDGEGYVCDASHRKVKQFYVAISNTDPGIIVSIEEALALFGVGYYKYFRPGRDANRCKAFWTITIATKAGMTALSKLVKFSSEKKQYALEAGLKYHQTRAETQKAFYAHRESLRPQIIALYKKAYSWREIQKRLGGSRNFIQQVIKESGLKVSHYDRVIRSRVEHGAPHIDSNSVIEDYQKGETLSAIAWKLKANPNRIRRILIKQNLYVPLTASEAVRRSWARRRINRMKCLPHTN